MRGTFEVSALEWYEFMRIVIYIPTHHLYVVDQAKYIEGRIPFSPTENQNVRQPTDRSRQIAEPEEVPFFSEAEVKRWMLSWGICCLVVL